MYQKNRILQMLAQNQIPLGMQCFTGDPILIEIMGLTGFDWVMLDSEHSGNNPRAMETLIRAADSVGITPFVRVGGEPFEHRQGSIPMVEQGTGGRVQLRLEAMQEIVVVSDAERRLRSLG